MLLKFRASEVHVPVVDAISNVDHIEAYLWKECVFPPETEFRFMYSGKPISRQQELSKIGITESSVLMVFTRKRRARVHTPTTVCDIGNETDAIKAFQKVLSLLSYPSGEKLRGFVNNAEEFNLFVSSVPGETCCSFTRYLMACFLN